jgi:Fatty acid hydroxylase superfamily
VTFLISLIVLLVVGDFASTFFYHVPAHVWNTLHMRTHHDNRRSYWDHSIVSRDPQILLDGFLGALPYFVIAVLLSSLGPSWMLGAVTGLLLGQLHVLWRHTCELGWVTPPWVVRVARATWLVLPEDHDGHHKDPDVEFGDLFRFYDAPARAVLVFARTRVLRKRRLTRLRAERAARGARRASA